MSTRIRSSPLVTHVISRTLKFYQYVVLVLFLLAILHFKQQIESGKWNRQPPGPDWYAVYGCSTPEGDNLRHYDYAFYLPLTALAWQRIGFRSLVLIIGTRHEWEQRAPLSWVLTHLEARKAVVVFMDAAVQDRPMLGQTARLFASNLDPFAGRADDFLITTDADLWPFHRDHFVPKPNAELTLVHANCCGYFTFNQSEYRMYAMSNVGATTRTWRQIMNQDHRWANDSRSIFDYFEDVYGPSVRIPPKIGDDNWYLDQKVISIRIQEWIDRDEKRIRDESVSMVSDRGFQRIDRSRWIEHVTRVVNKPDTLKSRFDAHLPVDAFQPRVWNVTKRLVELMYGPNTWEVNWANQYAKGFYEIMNQ